MTTLADLRRSRNLANDLTPSDRARLREAIGNDLAAVSESSPAYWRGHIDAALRQPLPMEDGEEYASGLKLGNRLVLVDGWHRYVDDSIEQWKQKNRRWVRGVGLVYDKIAQ